MILTRSVCFRSLTRSCGDRRRSTNCTREKSTETLTQTATSRRKRNLETRGMQLSWGTHASDAHTPTVTFYQIHFFLFFFFCPFWVKRPHKCINTIQPHPFWDNLTIRSCLSSLSLTQLHWFPFSIYEKLIQFCGIDELGTNYPKDMFDSHGWSEDSYYEALGTSSFVMIPAENPSLLLLLLL